MLKKLEQDHQIHTRWEESTKEYKEMKNAFSEQKKKQIYEFIWGASRRRQFLLKLKAKYAGKIFSVTFSHILNTIPFINLLDGQKIAKKLSVQISKETKKIKVLIPEYNTCQTIEGEAPVSLQEALDPETLSKAMYSKLYPSESRQEIIDAYLMIKRTTEEVSMLHADISNTLKYYGHMSAAVEKALSKFSLQDCFSRGAVSLLKSRKGEIDKMKEDLDRTNTLFQAMNELNQQNQYLDSDTEYESDTDEEF